MYMPVSVCAPAQVVSKWRHITDVSDSRIHQLRVLTARSVYVLRAVVQDWRKHARTHSDQPYDLTWDEVESFWQESSCVDWDSDSDNDSSKVMAETTSRPHHCDAGARHPMLIVSDVNMWLDKTSQHVRSGSIAFHIRELRSVPLSELLLNFPAALVHMKPFDIMKLYVYAVAGLSVLQAT